MGGRPHLDQTSDAAPEPSPGTGRPSILGGLARQWRRILLAWLVVSTPLVYAIYLMVEPVYEATSVLRIQPNAVQVFDTPVSVVNNSMGIAPVLLTQVQLITSDGVLDEALSNPKIQSLQMIRSSRDPKAVLKELLNVATVGDQTYLIRVSLASRDPAEAAAIVNAVVDAYLDQHIGRVLRLPMETELAKLEKKTQDVQGKLGEILRRRTIAAEQRAIDSAVVDSTIEQHTTYIKGTNGVVMLDVEAELAKLRKEILDLLSGLVENVGRGKIAADRRAVVRSVKEESESFQPPIGVVTEKEYFNMRSKLFDADIELIDAQARLEAAKQAGGTTVAEKLRELESAVEEAKRKRNGYSQYVAKLEVTYKNEMEDQLRATILKQELAYHTRLQGSVKSKLARLDFEIGQVAYRISVQNKAAVPKVPVKNSRLKYMAITPVGLLLIVIGLFLAQETVSSRASASEATTESSPRE